MHESDGAGDSVVEHRPSHGQGEALSGACDAMRTLRFDETWFPTFGYIKMIRSRIRPQATVVGAT